MMSRWTGSTPRDLKENRSVRRLSGAGPEAKRTVREDLNE